MESGGVLVRLREREDFHFLERTPVEHGVGRLTVLREAVRNVDRRIAREVRHREVALCGILIPAVAPAAAAASASPRGIAASGGRVGLASASASALGCR